MVYLRGSSRSKRASVGERVEGHLGGGLLGLAEGGTVVGALEGLPVEVDGGLEPRPVFGTFSYAGYYLWLSMNFLLQMSGRVPRLEAVASMLRDIMSDWVPRSETVASTLWDIVKEVWSGLCSEGRSRLCSEVIDHVSALKKLDEIHGNLNDEMKKLLAQKNDYQNRLRRCKSMMPTNIYKKWVCKVNRTEQQVKNLETKFNEEGKKSSILNFKQSLELCQEMEAKYESVRKLLEEGNHLGEILVDRSPKCVEVIAAPEIQKFQTMKMHVDEILNMLRDDKVKGIRIHGKVGSGKTAIMQSLNNHEEVRGMFDIVIWVKVSTEDRKGNLRIEELQKAIAGRLKLNIGSTSIACEVAKRISEDLMGKKFLLLLDDVYQDLNMYQLGIPESKNGSKIVLTTRFGRVCSSIVNRAVTINCLSEDEAWKLFCDVLEHPELIDHGKISPIARKIVKKCGGLPLVIYLVASDFRMRSEKEQWVDGYNNFRKWPDIQYEGLEELYKLLSFCYNNLSSEQKKCFSYAAIYSEDKNIPIDCLLDCWAAQNFLGSNDDADDLRIAGRGILQHLKNVSLLEDGKTPGDVRMHKIIRQVTLRNGECKSLVKTNEGLREPPDGRYWEEKNWVSLIGNELQHLPDSPDCSELSALLLQENLSLNTIPLSFFEHMEKVQILDLYFTGIVSLPKSLSKLITLKVLYLNNCKDLKKLPPQFEELQHLEVLDFRGSGITRIPHVIKKLMRLRRLLLSFPKDNSSDVDQNCKVISMLSMLKELVIDVNACRDQWSELLNASVQKITTLKLTNFQFEFLDEKVDVIKVEAATTHIWVPIPAVLRSFTDRSDLTFASFQVCIGCHSTQRQIPMSYEYERYLKCESYDPAVSELHAKADAFELVNHPNAKTLSEFGIESMNKVRGFLIESCHGIETIMDCNATMECPILPKLEQLSMKHLPLLKSIWKGYLPNDSLCQIKRLVLSDCPMLINIFSHGLVLQLSRIQQLEVYDCYRVEEVIVESENGRTGPHVLPNLQKMTLHNMPKLRSIWPDESMKWDSLKELEIHGCPRLSRLPFSGDNTFSLRSIKTESQWWDALRWKHPELKEHFQQYCTFSVVSTITIAVNGMGTSVAAAKRRLSAAEKGKAVVAFKECGKRLRV